MSKSVFYLLLTVNFPPYHEKIEKMTSELYETSTGESFDVFKELNSSKENIGKFFNALSQKETVERISILSHILDNYYLLSDSSEFNKTISDEFAKFPSEGEILREANNVNGLLEYNKLYQMNGVFFVIVLPESWESFDFEEYRKEFEGSYSFASDVPVI